MELQIILSPCHFWSPDGVYIKERYILIPHQQCNSHSKGVPVTYLCLSVFKISLLSYVPQVP